MLLLGFQYFSFSDFTEKPPLFPRNPLFLLLGSPLQGISRPSIKANS